MTDEEIVNYYEKLMDNLDKSYLTTDMSEDVYNHKAEQIRVCENIALMKNKLQTILNDNSEINELKEKVSKCCDEVASLRELVTRLARLIC